MFWRRFAITTIASLTALVSLVSVTNLAHASPAATFGPPTEGAKVILDETSIDGPAIMATYAPATVLAWTGTDTFHHLNLLASDDGLHYANKLILPETSLWRPALAFIDSGRGAPYGTIALAWTGTDAAHTLNLEFISTPDYTVTQKLTFWGETSFTAPALATINGDVNSDIYLSWAGTDSAHTLNVLRRSTNPVTQDKRILWGWSSISRPSLTTDPSLNSATAMILSWTSPDNNILFANTTDTVNWTMPSSSPLSAQSAWAPSMIAYYTTALPSPHWVAWTGNRTGSMQAMTVEYTLNYPNWSDQSFTTILTETAMSSPALAYNGDGTSRQVLLAWTGTDPERHVNVAVISA